VLAGLQGGDGGVLVHEVGGADADGVQPVHLQHFVVIVELGIELELLGELVQVLLVHVAAGDDLDVLAPAEELLSLEVGDAAGSDPSYPELL